METPPFSENAFVLGGPFLPMFAGRIFGPSGRPQAPGSLRRMVSWRRSAVAGGRFQHHAKVYAQKWAHESLNHHNLSMWVCLKIVYPIFPMVLLIIIPFLNGYFIGNIHYFQTNPCIYPSQFCWYITTRMIWNRQAQWSQVTALMSRIGPLAAPQLHRCPGKALENEASEGMAAKKSKQNKWWLNIFRDVFCSISGQFHSR